MVVRAPGPAETALRLETVPDPKPGAGQVVLQVQACGVCLVESGRALGRLPLRTAA